MIENKKKKQLNYKPGSVHSKECARHLSWPIVTNRLNRSTLWLERVALKRQFTRTFSLRYAQPTCHHIAGELLPHLLTLTSERGSYFLLRLFAFADNFPLRSGAPYAARTFLV